MGQFLRVNGDYNIKTVNGAKITLDTGPALAGGEVRITGNLVVEGTQTTVEAANLNVNDNVIVLNSGETGAGVSLTYSGIQIDRGTLAPVGILYDETTDAWLFPAGGPSVVVGGAATPFDYSGSKIRVKEILTDPNLESEFLDGDSNYRRGDLTLINSGTGVVSVAGTVTYERNVTDDDDIPNKKYVDDSILNNPTFQILRGDTRVIVADKDISSGDPGSLEYLSSETGFTTIDDESAVSVIVDNELVAQIYTDRLLVGDERRGVTGIEIDGINFEIRTESSVADQDIFIRTDNIGTSAPDGSTTGTGKLRTNVALKLDKRSNKITYESGFTLLYAMEPGIGNSGVWFSNDSLTGHYRYDELISKNKALVFSMLF